MQTLAFLLIILLSLPAQSGAEGSVHRGPSADLDSMRYAQRPHRGNSRHSYQHRPVSAQSGPRGRPGVMNTYLVADGERFAESSYAKARPGQKFSEGQMIYGWMVYEDEALASGAIVPAGQSIEECWQYPRLHVYMRKNFLERLPNVMPR